MMVEFELRLTKMFRCGASNVINPNCAHVRQHSQRTAIYTSFNLLMVAAAIHVFRAEIFVYNGSMQVLPPLQKKASPLQVMVTIKCGLIPDAAITNLEMSERSGDSGGP